MIINEERSQREDGEDMISSPMLDCRLFYDLNLSPKFNATTGRLAAAVIEYDAKQIFSFSHAEMLSFEKVSLYIRKVLIC